MDLSKALKSTYQKVLDSTFADETPLIEAFIEQLHHHAYAPKKIEKTAATLINIMRNRDDESLFDMFMREYGLDTEEGLAMMRLSEALLRIPDSRTANALIHDIVQNVDWFHHVSAKNTHLIRFSSAGMEIAKRLFNMGDIVSTPTNPVIRRLLKLGVYQLGDHFICGKTIDRAIANSKKLFKQGFLFSYDMLGESARTEAQAEQYTEAYLSAISALSLLSQSNTPIEQRSGISVKLSALFSHYNYARKERVFKRLLPRLKTILLAAKEAEIPVSIDAEEAHRLDISLSLFTELCHDEDLRNYQGLGIVLQAYQKRAYSTIEYIIALAKETNRRIPVRLVKGAYWDAEIKFAQEQGLPDYPVFTRKCHTDISYMACAYRLLDAEEEIYPQFATHNAYTTSSIIEAAGNRSFEFQFLYGMGNGLYDSLAKRYPCRVYAPVGGYQELLAYLIRRLLENGANTSFVKYLVDHDIPVKDLCEDPITRFKQEARTALPKPEDVFLPTRENSKGLNPFYRRDYEKLEKDIEQYQTHKWQAYSIISGSIEKGESHPVTSPYDTTHHIGDSFSCKTSQVNQALKAAKDAFYRHWQYSHAEDRATIIEKYARLLEANSAELISLCIKEAGKTVEDSIADVREAIDFCYYYAEQARELCGTETILPGPAGEENKLSLHGRGIFVCISPWNFPLAIFVGQVIAGLASGNTVIAKPAAQTTIIATRAIELLLEAGMPTDVVHLILGKGSTVGQALIQSKEVDGITFTGSTQTAAHIYRTRAEIGMPIIPVIAETGGLNTMIVDSSVLLEQTVDHIIRSAFGSAGQRCSALRAVFVDQTIEEPLLNMLAGAMQELNVDIPEHLSTDVGSVIDAQAQSSLLEHIERMKSEHKLVAATPLSEENVSKGYFVAPHCFKVSSLEDIGGEHFGPVLHIISYKSNKLEQVIDAINNTGFGLTLGIQTRILSRAEFIRKRVHVGNIYINRAMTGAVVGVQPFGGEGLSGTGPKAGGPHYLTAFMTERTSSHDTTAIGGNRDLLIK